MSNFPILDLVIGIVFIFFLLSIICSSAVELWFSIMKTRARLLEEWLKRIFDSKALDSEGNLLGISVGQAIMDHCMVTVLSKTSKSPSYINAETFVSALLDKITIKKADSKTTQVQMPPTNLAGYITTIQNSTVISGELKRTILSFAYQAQITASTISNIPVNANVTTNITTTIKSDIDQFRERLENWYNTNAERLTGAMKRRKAIPATLIIGLILTVGMNADSITISKYLYNHPEVSKTIAEKALLGIQQQKARVDTIENHLESSTKTQQVNIKELEKETNTLQNDINTFKTSLPQGLPMGWQDEKYDWSKEFGNSLIAILKLHGVGWLATILAINLGAPFWFDILNKIANLRSTGPKPAPSTNDDNNKNK